MCLHHHCCHCSVLTPNMIELRHSTKIMKKQQKLLLRWTYALYSCCSIAARCKLTICCDEQTFVVLPFNLIQTYHCYLTKNECEWWMVTGDWLLVTVVVCFLLSLYAAIKTRQCFNYSAIWFDYLTMPLKLWIPFILWICYNVSFASKYEIRNSKYLCILHLSLQFIWFENKIKNMFTIHREIQKCLCGMLKQNRENTVKPNYFTDYICFFFVPSHWFDFAFLRTWIIMENRSISIKSQNWFKICNRSVWIRCESIDGEYSISYGYYYCSMSIYVYHW